MKLQLKIITATATILLLSACGGGGGGGGGGETPTVTKIEKCTTTKMTSLKKDDKITALTDDTELKIIHNEDGTKEACVVSGDAKIN